MLRLTATAKAAPAHSNLRFIGSSRIDPRRCGYSRAAEWTLGASKAHAGDICRCGDVRCEEVGKADCPRARGADRLGMNMLGSQGAAGNSNSTAPPPGNRCTT